MRPHAGWPAASLATLLSCGCLAPVQETHAFGVSHPAPGAEAVAAEERAASPTGEVCRTVTTTKAVREVDIRRSFVDPRLQDADVAFAVLAGIGATFVAYDASKLACRSDLTVSGPSNDSPTCSTVLSSATWPIAAATAALAVVPLVFATINAARVQSEVRTVEAPPFTQLGPWQPCAPER